MERHRHDRPGLDLPAILDAAEEVVDELGWDGLTMSALARHVGVQPPSLYHHVDGIDAVRGALQARCMADLGEVLVRASDGRRGLDGVAAQARAQRAFARRHPHRYEGFARASIDPVAMGLAAARAVEVVHEMLSSAGVPDAALTEVRRTIFVAHHGFIALEGAGFFPPDTATDDLFDRVVEGSLRTVVAAAEAGRRIPESA